jgi:hypothetical protein
VSGLRRRIVVECLESKTFTVEIPIEDEPMFLKNIQEAIASRGMLSLWGIGKYAQWGTTVHLIRTENVIGVTIHNVS